MTDGSSGDRFLATVPIFALFGQILDPELYAALPDDWVVGIADVVSSTQAIEAGHYKRATWRERRCRTRSATPRTRSWLAETAQVSRCLQTALQQHARRSPAPQPLSPRSMASSSASLRWVAAIRAAGF